jgi:hypothetical protein
LQKKAKVRGEVTAKAGGKNGADGKSEIFFLIT